VEDDCVDIASAPGPDGDVVAVGDDWTTVTDTFQRPEWLDRITRLIIAPEPTTWPSPSG